ncbi:MAG: acyl-CoA thioesterase [Candidatus Omnitrophica bacterium]|nr:acyl-CoA thioesterase [Candidatus Omnitrophota bacterium]
MFYANQLKMVHDAYEALLEHIGLGFHELLVHKNFRLPIVHTEADFKSPLSVGDLIDIQAKVLNIKTTSFTLSYVLANAAGTVVGAAQTVHVSVDKRSLKKIPLPPDLRDKLKRLQAEDQPKRTNRSS